VLLALATRILTGEEKLVSYHLQLAVFGSSALLLHGLGYPLLPYLDLSVLGIGFFLACGRMGCLLVGCCHGRPHTWGVLYRDRHRAEGLPAYFVGVRLFPIQAVEGLWLVGTVLLGFAMIRAGASPGAVLAWYIVAYGAGRFWFEFLRGDVERPHLWGFSEAQWTAFVLIAATAGAEWAGLLPSSDWHTGAAAALGLTMAGLGLRRAARDQANGILLDASHVGELAAVLRLAAPPAGAGSPTSMGAECDSGVRVHQTSQGLRISAGRVRSAAVGAADHFAFSFEQAPLEENTARRLARLILRLRDTAGPAELVAGGHGVYHLLVRT
jgi:hypothetical protein